MLKQLVSHRMINDAPPNSLMDSNVSPKREKQQKDYELGHDPWLATLWG
jgi:hypothetical protein